MQAEQFLCWSGMTDTEHTTSGSNEDHTQCTTVHAQEAQQHRTQNLSITSPMRYRY